MPVRCRANLALQESLRAPGKTKRNHGVWVCSSRGVRREGWMRCRVSWMPKVPIALPAGRPRVGAVGAEGRLFLSKLSLPPSRGSPSLDSPMAEAPLPAWPLPGPRGRSQSDISSFSSSRRSCLLRSGVGGSGKGVRGEEGAGRGGSALAEPPELGWGLREGASRSRPGLTGGAKRCSS